MGSTGLELYDWATAGWQLRDVVGRGAFATVWAVVRGATGEQAVVKVLAKCENRAAVLAAEADIMLYFVRDLPRGCQHLVRPMAAFEDEENVYLLMELCRGPLLSDVIAVTGHLREAMAGLVMWQLVEAVATLHRLGILHRDLKPENVMWKGRTTRGPIRVIPSITVFDFGLARREGKPDAVLPRELVGTISYIAPEVFMSRKYGYSCDVWALGIILYEMLCGDVPFANETQIRMAPIDFREQAWGGVSREAKDLVCVLLERSPMRRPTAAQVLEHPWMRAVVGSAEWKHVQERGERFVDAPTTLHSTEGKDAELQEASFGGAQVSAKWAALHDRQCHILHRLAGLEGRTEQCGPGG